MTDKLIVSRSEIEALIKEQSYVIEHSDLYSDLVISIDELRAILDKAEKNRVEPVGWTITSPDGVTVKDVPDYAFYSESDAIAYRSEHCFKSCNVVPLYTSPPAPIQAEPVAYRFRHVNDDYWRLAEKKHIFIDNTKLEQSWIYELLYTSPPAEAES